MRTDFLLEWFHSIKLRYNELEALKDLVEGLDKNSQRQNILLKSYTVFLVSNFEGALKSLVQSYIEDLNRSDLSIISLNIRCHHASHFTEDGPKIKKLATLFNENKIPIDKKLFPGVHINYNPKESNIKKLFKNIGEEDLVNKLSTELFDCLFTEDHAEQQELELTLDEYLDKSLGASLRDYTTFDFKESDKSISSFWSNFIEDIMLKRNNIVHGSELAEGIALDEIKVVTLKTFVFIKAACLVILNNHKGSI